MDNNVDILVADDERTMLVTLTILLEEAGYSVRSARDGEAALRLYDEKKPDLVLLDVMMPKMDGLAVCRKIRETDAETPVLFLTALGNDESELEGLGCGADDYIRKSLPEPLFLARVAAALRRKLANPSGVFAIGAWTVRGDESAMYSGSESVDLTDREIALLRLFSKHPCEILSREFLINEGWGRDADVLDGVLSVAISGLRKKLKSEAEKIVSVRGVGYSYRP